MNEKSLDSAKKKIIKMLDDMSDKAFDWSLFEEDFEGRMQKPEKAKAVAMRAINDLGTQVETLKKKIEEFEGKLGDIVDDYLD